MILLITLLAGLALLPLSPSILAADAPFATPEAIIEELYNSDPSVFNPTEDIKLSKRYLGKNLIALLVRNQFAHFLPIFLLSARRYEMKTA